MEFLDVLYSVAGQKHERIHAVLDGFRRDLLTSKESLVLSAMLDAFTSSGEFLSLTYLTDTYGPGSQPCKRMSDITTALKEIAARRDKDRISNQIQEILATSSDTVAIREGISTVLESHRPSTVTVSKFRGMSGVYNERKGMKGFRTGVHELDEMTNGFLPGYVAVVAAWTSHGKSMFLNNAAYLNALDGKKVVILSLEIPSEGVYQILMSRRSFDKNKSPVPYSAILQAKMTTAQEDYLFKEIEPEFRDTSAQNTLVIEESDIQSFTKEGVFSTLRQCEDILGGLDFVILDHANLLHYVNPEDRSRTGDHYVKMFSDVARLFRTSDGKKVGVGLAAQTNREGWKEAGRNDGRYKMSALSEFHELERSATYVVFLYSDPLMMQVNEMKVHLQKHRIGGLMPDPVITNVYAPCSVIGDSFQISVSGDALDSTLSDFFDTDGPAISSASVSRPNSDF